MSTQTSYGPGGVIEWRLVDNGDGTGTRTVYAPDGSVTATEPVTGLPLPVPEPDPVAPLEAMAAAQSLEEVREAAAALLDALVARGVI